MEKKERRRAMANKRKLTPDELEAKVEAYFDSISYDEPVMRRQLITTKDSKGNDIPVLDQYGHELYTYVPVKLKNGNIASRTEWTESPSVIAMSLFIGVDRITLWRWKENPGKKPEELTPTEKRICNILTRAWGRVEAYLTERSEDKNASRGAIANLQANFGWKKRSEVGLSADTTEAMKETVQLTAGQKLEALRELGLRLPWEEEERSEEE